MIVWPPYCLSETSRLLSLSSSPPLLKTLRHPQNETQTISKSKSVRHTGLFMAKFLVKRVKRFVSELPSRDHERNVIEFDEETKIPKDVRKGHFAVIAMKGGESKRFILELSYLRNSKILRLLERAKEEYGFQQMGALIVPCQPEELQMILEHKI